MSEREREGISSRPCSPTEDNIKTLDYVNVVVNLINYSSSETKQHLHDPELRRRRRIMFNLHLRTDVRQKHRFCPFCCFNTARTKQNLISLKLFHLCRTKESNIKILSFDYFVLIFLNCCFFHDIHFFHN